MKNTRQVPSVDRLSCGGGKHCTALNLEALTSVDVTLCKFGQQDVNDLLFYSLVCIFLKNIICSLGYR